MKTLLSLALAVTFILSGCAKPLGAPDSATLPFFAGPVSVMVPIGHVTAVQGSNFQYNLDAPICEMANLISWGVLHISPAMATSEHWKIGNEDENQGKSLPVALGMRAITSRFEQKSWKSGPNEYYGETITYQLTGKAGPGGFNKPIGPFSVRIIYQNAPEIGHWTLQSITPVSGGDENEAINNAIMPDSANCNQAKAILTASIGSSLSAAYSMIETNLASSGTIARTSDPYVLFSKKNGIYYHTNGGAFTSLSAKLAIEYCGNLKPLGRTNWKVASDKEFKDILIPLGAPNGGAYRLPDRPDGALWGGIGDPAGANGSVTYGYVTSDYIQNGVFLSIYGLPEVLSPGSSLMAYYMDSNGALHGENVWAVFNQTPSVQWLQTTWNSPLPTRVLCVSRA